MKLQEFTPQDLEGYITLATKFHSGPASFTAPDVAIFERNFDYIVNHDSAFGWFIYEEGYVCGYVLCSMMYSTEVGGLSLWVEELSVEDGFQGKGIGSKTLNSLIEMFPEVKRFRLEVAPSNESAKKLYKRLGYDFIAYEQMIIDR
ncbi:GNAT family N-acetyltransferase [Erysipelothrix sp. HDW6C]|uniref:GNAT family N-acetyltransferase n=1 Tax=Erysipelothrix sp. HDW6C TaxID=2714930 RepID=UPI00140A5B3A|nr:GNAT family N-acetyltransferase [Erysipelothrix sp. HDW6C]QIK69911.1 GNAT family N-acetyltransferase [Erysipelothrix sp. HDW6C]